MGMNSRIVIDRWRRRVPFRKHRSIWTDGDGVYSYDGCLLTLDPELGILYNPTPYTTTTKRHQNAIERFLQELNAVYTEVTGPLPFDVSAAALREKARTGEFGADLRLVCGGEW